MEDRGVSEFKGIKARMSSAIERRYPHGTGAPRPVEEPSKSSA